MIRDSSFEPAYLKLHRSGELARRAAAARERMKDCDLCARYCRMNRLETIKGAVCRTGEKAVVSSFHAHPGEEDPLRGRRGSGTIFFSWCNLRCLFCQNFDISWEGEGVQVTAEQLAAMMIDLQQLGCHNINFVSPSHVVAQILEALALLDGVIDIYMPDAKYGASNNAKKYSKVPGYTEVNRAAIGEMHRQVGDLVLDGEGIAMRGLLVRHLVLPGGLAGTEEVLRFLAEEISTDTYLNLMFQYRPCYRASEHPELDRRPSEAEFREAYAIAESLGLKRLDERRRLAIALNMF